MNPAQDRRFLSPTARVSLLLAIVTFLAYLPALQSGFVNFDDDRYVLPNPNVQKGLTIAGVKWAFTTFDVGNWHPLSWLSWQLDAQVFGGRPWGYHLTNLLLHVANTVLWFLFWKRFASTVWPAALLAALFALHPLHVESVAWVSERKDVLSTLFWVLTMLAYARYAEKPSLAGYLLVCVAFSLGLMSKPMVVTLPFVLLLLDYWPLCRFPFSPASPTNPYRATTATRLVVEKVPLLALTLFSCVLTFRAQAEFMAPLAGLSIGVRIQAALVAYVSYLAKTLWPVNLSALYPHSAEIPLWQSVGAAVVLIAISWFALRCWRTRPYALVGWLWYLGTLVPVIGLVQVGSQSMADRYTYVPLIGIFLIVSWGLADRVWSSAAQTWLAFATVAVLALAGAATWVQAGYWRDGEALWSHALSIDNENALAHYNLGQLHLERRQLAAAEKHFAESVRIDPGIADSHYGLAQLLMKKGAGAEAQAHLEAALRINGSLVLARHRLAILLIAQGQLENALDHLSAGLKYEPNNPRLLYETGRVLARQGRLEDALPYLSRASEADGQSVPIRCALGGVLHDLGRRQDAAAEFRRGFQIDSRWADKWNQQAWRLATHPNRAARNGALALEYARQTCQGTEFRQPIYLNTLAAALAECDRYDEAVVVIRQALALDVVAQNADLARAFEEQKQRYENRQPFRDARLAVQ
jgi:tetratricopeptide (TPR) repeat protein